MVFGEATAQPDVRITIITVTDGDIIVVIEKS